MTSNEDVNATGSDITEEETGRLLQLFNACDTKGTGFIGRDDLREICVGLGMSSGDADALFKDLDRDQNGLIDFNDFAEGFGDFIYQRDRGSGSNRRLLSTNKRSSKVDSPLLPPNLNVCDVEDIEDVLQAMSTSPKLASCIQTVVKSLVNDMERLKLENNRLEDIYKSEKEKHEKQLRQIEDEIDSQVLKMEETIRQKVKSEAEIERQALKEKMDQEMSELQTHLKLFQTFDTMMNKDRDEENRLRKMQQRLEEASSENRKLRMTLTDTKTNIALLNAELSHLRNQYEEKCEELHSERESSFEYLHEHQHLDKQLNLLHETNKRLQDVNDSIRSAMETNNNCHPKTLRNSIVQRLQSKRGSIIGDYLAQETLKNSAIKPITSSHRSKSTGHLLQKASNDIQEVDSLYESMSAKSPRVMSPTPFQLPSDELGKSSGELSYPIKRFMEDIDSGLSKSCNALDVTHHSSTQLDDAFEDVDLGVGPVPPSPSSGWAVLPISQVPPQVGTTAHRGRVYGIARTASRASLQKNLAKQQQEVLEQLRKNSNDGSSNYEPTGPPDRIYKVVFAGDAAVGKTSFILRISRGFFVPTSTSTLGVDFHVKTMRVDEKNVTLQLWDTAGQERFRSITKSYFRRADGVMLLYDCTNEHSFINVRDWMEAIDEVAEKKVPVMLCANKIDLRETSVLQGKSIVRTEDGERLAREFSAIFIETSTKNGKHVVDALIQLTREMASNEDWEVQTSGLRITQMEMSKKSVMCCGK